MSDLAFLDRRSSSYDTVAASYATLFADDLPQQPVKRSMLRLFAELADGPAADVGSRPSTSPTASCRASSPSSTASCGSAPR
jgi:hypothetical protein